MACSGVFNFLAVALCLLVCFSAAADETKESEINEESKMEENAPKDTENALNEAKQQLKKANSILNRVKLHKLNAKEAAEEAEEVELNTKGNTEAEAIAKEAINAVEKVNELYPTAKTAAETAVKSINKLIKSAETLNKNDKLDLSPNSVSSHDSLQTKKKSVEVEDSAKALENQKTEAAELLTAAEYLEGNMSHLLLYAKRIKYQIIIVYSCTEIENDFKNAEIYVEYAEEQLDEINDTMSEIMELSKDAAEDLFAYSAAVLENGRKYLFSASRVFKRAQRIKETIKKLKTFAEDAFEKVKEIKNTKESFAEVRKAKKYAEEVTKKVLRMESAAKSVAIYAINAKNAKESFKKALLEGKSEFGNKIHQKPKKWGQGFFNAPEDVQNAFKIRPTMMSSDKMTFTDSDNPMHRTSDNTTIKKKDKLKNKNSDIINDILSKNTHSGDKNSVIEGNVHNWDAKIDSAMSLSVSLLLALIASAVLR